MRTKTLLLTAALSAAAAASSMADVFSVNVVGYVNVTLTNGFTLLGNPLTSSNNAIGTVLPSVPDGSIVYKLLPSGAYNTDIYAGGTWFDTVTENPSTTTLAPGEGFFVFSPSVSNVTFVGEVKTGTNSIGLRPGFTLVSSVVPQTYELTGANFPAVDGYQHYELVGGAYKVSIAAGGTWYDTITENPTTVSAKPAVGFFMYNNGASNTWTRAFSVNQ